MCGIFGIISKQAADCVDSSLFAELGRANTVRGNLGFGGLVVANRHLEIYRYSQPFDTSKVSLDGAQIVLGHVRAPTAGYSNNLAEVHPFETSDLLLAHNGILLNHAEFPQWRIHPELGVDSQVILGGIQSLSDQGEALEEAIQHTIEVLDGQQACWLWQKSSQTLFLWRVMSPIYLGETGNATIFSSVKTSIANTLLDEGVIYRFDPTMNRFEHAGDFRFYSPYRMN